jgi:hypothetical protein
MAEHGDEGVIIDCDTCTVRGDACADCVVSVILGPPGQLAVEPDERRALQVLASSGLVPELRMAPPEGSRHAV